MKSKRTGIGKSVLVLAAFGFCITTGTPSFTADKSDIILFLTAPFVLVMIVAAMVTGIKEVELKAPLWDDFLPHSDDLSTWDRILVGTQFLAVGSLACGIGLIIAAFLNGGENWTGGLIPISAGTGLYLAVLIWPLFGKK